VIQNNFGNHSPSYPNVIVAAITTKGRDIPFHVPVPASVESGLRENSHIKCEQILTVRKQRLAGTRPRGRVNETIMEKVSAALKLSLDLA